MNIFIENMNTYLSGNRIKNSYISLLTGWDKSKVSRILSGEADLKMQDAETLANVLGKDVSFFLDESKIVSQHKDESEQFAFYAGHLEENDMKIAKDLLDMFRYYDSLVNLKL